jgi:plastocyanin
MRLHLLRAAAVAAVVLSPLGACGGGSKTSGDIAGTTFTVHAKDVLKFDKSEYDAPAGQITIGYKDDGTLVHTLVIDGHPEFQKLEVGSNKKEATGTVTLPSGTYTLYCDVPGHRAAGMQAKLVVK